MLIFRIFCNIILIYANLPPFASQGQFYLLLWCSLSHIFPPLPSASSFTAGLIWKFPSCVHSPIDLFLCVADTIPLTTELLPTRNFFFCLMCSYEVAPDDLSCFPPKTMMNKRNRSVWETVRRCSNYTRLFPFQSKPCMQSYFVMVNRHTELWMKTFSTHCTAKPWRWRNVINATRLLSNTGQQEKRDKCDNRTNNTTTL